MDKKITEYEKYIVKMTQNAEDDLDEIIIFIARNNPKNAMDIMEKIQEKVSSSDHFPNRGSYVPELLARNIKEYRQLTEGPRKIIYKVNDDIVNIFTIIDSRRNLKDTLIKKNIEIKYAHTSSH